METRDKLAVMNEIRTENGEIVVSNRRAAAYAVAKGGTVVRAARDAGGWVCYVFDLTDTQAREALDAWRNNDEGPQSVQTYLDALNYVRDAFPTARTFRKEEKTNYGNSDTDTRE